MALDKVRHNLKLLRKQIFPETKYRFVLRTLWGDDSYTIIAKDTTEASVKLAKRLEMSEAELAAVLKEVYEFKDGRWIKIFPVETKAEVFPESLRLKPLFDMQDSLIEHRFPHDKAEIIDTIISHAGDIYREMTHAYPHHGYVNEKWEKLSVYCARPPLSWLQAGDWEEIRKQLQNPSYKTLRDQFLSNLQRLREETVKTSMDPKRKAVMTESLDMIKALIFWFESRDPYAPPKWQLDRLTDAIYNYFPREFFKSLGVQTPDPLPQFIRISDLTPEGFIIIPYQTKEYPIHGEGFRGSWRDYIVQVKTFKELQEHLNELKKEKYGFNRIDVGVPIKPQVPGTIGFRIIGTLSWDGNKWVEGALTAATFPPSSIER